MPDCTSGCQDLGGPFPSSSPFHSPQFFTPARERAPAAPRQFTGARASARERVRGEPEQDGGRAEDAAWATATAVRSIEPRSLSPAGPGSAAPTRPRLVFPHPFSAAAASARVRPGRGAATPKLWPYPGPKPLPRAPHGPCPLPAPPGPDCPLASIACSLGLESHSSQPWPANPTQPPTPISRHSAPASKEHPLIPARSVDPAVSAPDSTLASS